MAYKYVIIGSGVAGVTAAKEIRKQDTDGSMLMLGDENREPYFRIQLSHLLAEESPELPRLNKDGWSEKLKMECRLDGSVQAVDFDSMTVTTGAGEEVKAEKILLANGSHANFPPLKNNALEGIYTLRSFDDLLKIQAYLKGAGRVGVIGGGLLGLEAAKSLQDLGHEVAIVDMEEYLLSKQLDRELGMLLNEEMKDNGFMVYTGRATKGFIGEEKVSGIEFDDGTVIDLDCVLVSIGVRPNTALFEGTELEVNRGVVVNERLETNLKNVWAAGDVAEVDGRVMGIWPASLAMGKVAGGNMAGGEKTYENPQAFTKLDIGDIEVFSAGEVGGGEVYFYDEGDVHHRLFAEDGRVKGVILYNDTSGMNTYKRLVAEEAPIEEALDAKYPFTSEKK